MESKNYLESVEVCDSILKTKEKQRKFVMMQSKLVKGKARFYVYKRKLMHYLMNKNMRVTKEGSSILDECFSYMKEAIALLGNALDENFLDAEGSRLLDWAMIDCLSTTNQLNSCKRCLVCRQKKSLRKSHIWPLSVIKSLTESVRDNSCVFGLDEHKLKSVGTCTYQMLCFECEQRLSQNGENQFQDNFQPACAEINYSSWLFSFCAGLLFRCLSTVITFPKHFNDGEIYKVLLECRKNILSLKITINKKEVTMNECEVRQLKELNSHLDGTLGIFLFISPLKTQQDYGIYQMPYPQASIILSNSLKLHKRKQFFSGHVHFLLLCCGPITLIMNFDQSLCTLKKRGFHLTPSSTTSDQRYAVQSEENCIALLPVGVWALLEKAAEHSLNSFSNVFRFMPSSAKQQPVIQPETAAEKSVVVKDPDVKLPFNYLPKEYKIKPYVGLPHGESVTLPDGHLVIIHSTLSVPSQNTDLTFLLCIDEPNSTADHECLYVIFSAGNINAHFSYLDGVAVEVQDNKLVLTKFLQQNKIADKMRYNLSCLQQLLNKVLPNKHYDNINLLVHLVKFRRFVD